MVCWPGWRSHHLARGRADQRGQDLGSAWMNGDDVGEVMWAPVQRTGQGDAGRLGGKMQVQALTHPRSNGKRDAGRKARQQRKPLTGEASHASAVQEAAQQKWMEVEATRARQDRSGANGRSAVGSLPCRAAAPLHVTGAAPPCAQDSPGCCRRTCPRRPMRAQKAHFEVPLGSRPSTPSGGSCYIWGLLNEETVHCLAVISGVPRIRGSSIWPRGTKTNKRKAGGS
jgi:hypothetical protein